jgi:hypothetical protein
VRSPSSPGFSSRESYVRIQVARRNVASSIPPAPLARHSDLSTVEWWLQSQVNVASNLHCLEQMLAAMRKTPSEAIVLLKTPVGPLNELRDALFEVYCDVGDPRVKDVLGEPNLLNEYVRALYELCDSTLEALTNFAAEVQNGTPDSERVRSDLARGAATFASAASTPFGPMLEALRSFAIDPTDPKDPKDSTDPTPPLQHVVQHIGQMVSAATHLLEAISPH